VRVAALADVHGNAPALAAVLAEVEREAPDLVVFCGDLTWGALPGETIGLVRALEIPTRFVRGNAERALLELRAGEVAEPTAREQWMLGEHGEEDLAWLAAFEPTVSADVDGLGPTCFCHGSPRSDEECVTEETPPERVREFTADRDEHVIVTAHVHLPYERVVGDVRLLGPGSVGLPYGEGGAAFWALLGPGVELRRTEYDMEDAIARMRATGDPKADEIAGMMLTPPTREEIVEFAEANVFAG
jgi:predicted phosphodiesterase